MILGAQLTLDKVKELSKSGKINLYTKYQLDKVNELTIMSIDIKHDDGEIKNLNRLCLGFFWFNNVAIQLQIGGLIFDKTIEVDTEKFETNQKGIYVMIFVISPGKLKLFYLDFMKLRIGCESLF